jgi:hypothetical protein
LTTLSNAVAVGGGFGFSSVLTADGDIYNWGDNFFGQLGQGNDEELEGPQFAMTNVQLPDNAGVTIKGMIKSYNPKRVTTVTLYKAGTDTVVKTERLPTTNETGLILQEFELKGIEAGVYDLKITKETHLSYTLTGIPVGSTDLNLMDNSNSAINICVLRCGDIDNDGYIVSADLAQIILLANYNKAVTEPGVNPKADLTGSGIVDSASIGIVILSDHYNKTPIIQPYTN